MTASTLTVFPEEHQHMTPPHLLPVIPGQATAHGPVDTGNLWKWVDRLTRDRKHRLVRQAHGSKPTVEHVPVPSLLTQLQEALTSTNSGGGRGKSSTGSRSPLDLATEALLIEISDTVVFTLRAHGSKPRVDVEETKVRQHPIAAPQLGRLDNDDRTPLQDPDTAGRLAERAARASVQQRAQRATARVKHDLAADLRQLATVIVGTRDAKLIDQWIGRYRSWVARAETTLTADDESINLRAVRGHACPVCLALWVTSIRDNVEFRDPALVIAFRDGQVQHITCRACETGWWRGDDVQLLTQQIVQNESIYGPATSGWGQTVRKAGA